MNARDLTAIGFEDHGDALRAPEGSAVCFVPLDARCFRLSIRLPSGGGVECVVAAVALRCNTKEEER